METQRSVLLTLFDCWLWVSFELIISVFLSSTVFSLLVIVGNKRKFYFTIYYQIMLNLSKLLIVKAGVRYIPSVILASYCVPHIAY